MSFAGGMSTSSRILPSSRLIFWNESRLYSLPEASMPVGPWMTQMKSWLIAGLLIDASILMLQSILPLVEILTSPWRRSEYESLSEGCISSVTS